jgi:hypothetical protein
MKRGLGGLVTVALLVGVLAAWIWRHFDQSDVQQELNITTTQSSSSSTGAPVVRTPSFVTQASEELQKRYQSAIQKIADEVKAAGLSTQELNDEAVEYENQEEFIQKLPPKVASAYRQLHGVIHELQDASLKAAGKDRSFFQRYHVEKPEWMTRHEEGLKQVALPPVVQKFVETRAEANEILDEDVQQVVQLCGEEKKCIEKSAYLWIGANHVLSEAQFKILGRYL